MLLEFITLASGFNFLLLAVVLFLKKAPNKTANNIIGVFFLMMSVYTYLVSFRFNAMKEGNYPDLAIFPPFEGFFLLLLTPCIYLYIRLTLNKPVIVKKWSNLLHLVPFVPYVIFNIYFYTFFTAQERIDWYVRGFNEGNIESSLLNGVNYIQIPIYLLMSYFLIKNKLKESRFVDLGYMLIDITWIRTFLIINLSFILLTAPLIFYLANENANIIIGSLAMDIQFVYLFYKVAWQKDSLTSESYKSRLKHKDRVLKVDNQIADDYLKTLEDFMKNNKPYLQEDCNIQNIADNTGVTVHQLSNVINNRLKKNFSDYINEYRISESQMLLNSNSSDRLTIEAVGFTCGFGSKSSFNKAFKKHTNLTPSEYRIMIKEN